MRHTIGKDLAKLAVLFVVSESLVVHLYLYGLLEHYQAWELLRQSARLAVPLTLFFMILCGVGAIWVCGVVVMGRGAWQKWQGKGEKCYEATRAHPHHPDV